MDFPRRRAELLASLSPEGRATYEVLRAQLARDVDRSFAESNVRLPKAMATALGDLHTNLDKFASRIDAVKQDLRSDIADLRRNRRVSGERAKEIVAATAPTTPAASQASATSWAAASMLAVTTADISTPATVSAPSAYTATSTCVPVVAALDSSSPRVQDVTATAPTVPAANVDLNLKRDIDRLVGGSAAPESNPSDVITILPVSTVLVLDLGAVDIDATSIPAPPHANCSTGGLSHHADREDPKSVPWDDHKLARMPPTTCSTICLDDNIQVLTPVCTQAVTSSIKLQGQVLQPLTWPLFRYHPEVDYSEEPCSESESVGIFYCSLSSVELKAWPPSLQHDPWSAFLLGQTGAHRIRVLDCRQHERLKQGRECSSLQVLEPPWPPPTQEVLDSCELSSVDESWKFWTFETGNGCVSVEHLVGTIPSLPWDPGVLISGIQYDEGWRRTVNTWPPVTFLSTAFIQFWCSADEPHWNSWLGKQSCSVQIVKNGEFKCLLDSNSSVFPLVKLATGNSSDHIGKDNKAPYFGWKIAWVFYLKYSDGDGNKLRLQLHQERREVLIVNGLKSASASIQVIIPNKKRIVNLVREQLLIFEPGASIILLQVLPQPNVQLTLRILDASPMNASLICLMEDIKYRSDNLPIVPLYCYEKLQTDIAWLTDLAYSAIANKFRQSAFPEALSHCIPHGMRLCLSLKCCTMICHLEIEISSAVCSTLVLHLPWMLNMLQKCNAIPTVAAPIPATYNFSSISDALYCNGMELGTAAREYLLYKSDHCAGVNTWPPRLYLSVLELSFISWHCAASIGHHQEVIGWVLIKTTMCARGNICTTINQTHRLQNLHLSCDPGEQQYYFSKQAETEGGQTSAAQTYCCDQYFNNAFYVDQVHTNQDYYLKVFVDWFSVSHDDDYIGLVQVQANQGFEVGHCYHRVPGEIKESQVFSIVHHMISQSVGIKLQHCNTHPWLDFEGSGIVTIRGLSSLTYQSCLEPTQWEIARPFDMAYSDVGNLECSTVICCLVIEIGGNIINGKIHFALLAMTGFHGDDHWCFLGSSYSGFVVPTFKHFKWQIARPPRPRGSVHVFCHNNCFSSVQDYVLADPFYLDLSLPCVAEFSSLGSLLVLARCSNHSLSQQQYAIMFVLGGSLEASTFTCHLLLLLLMVQVPVLFLLHMLLMLIRLSIPWDPGRPHVYRHRLEGKPNLWRGDCQRPPPSCYVGRTMTCSWALGLTKRYQGVTTYIREMTTSETWLGPDGGFGR